MVPRRGLEPPRLLHHWHLKPARLPIPPPGPDTARVGRPRFRKAWCLGRRGRAVNGPRRARAGRKGRAPRHRVRGVPCVGAVRYGAGRGESSSRRDGIRPQTDPTGGGADRAADAVLRVGALDGDAGRHGRARGGGCADVRRRHGDAVRRDGAPGVRPARGSAERRPGARQGLSLLRRARPSRLCRANRFRCSPPPLSSSSPIGRNACTSRAVHPAAAPGCVTPPPSSRASDTAPRRPFAGGGRTGLGRGAARPVPVQRGHLHAIHRLRRRRAGRHRLRAAGRARPTVESVFGPGGGRHSRPQGRAVA